MISHCIHPRHHFAFTLIELLVVISIVSLLIAILLPALGKARESARQVKCMVTLKNLAVANQVYQADNHDYFVPVFMRRDFKNNDFYAVAWYANPMFRSNFGITGGSMQSLIGRWPVEHVCPSATYALRTVVQSLKETNMWASYGMNDQLYKADWTNIGSEYNAKNIPAITLRTTDIRNVSNRIFMTDGLRQINLNYWTANYYAGEEGTGFGTAYRHNSSSANVLMHDGHVINRTREYLLSHEAKVNNWYIFSY
tara:strand:- start:4777 stop:5538 length:762 start_codon:yes stop_codon:yes gene_type:complete